MVEAYKKTLHRDINPRLNKRRISSLIKNVGRLLQESEALCRILHEKNRYDRSTAKQSQLCQHDENQIWSCSDWGYLCRCDILLVVGSQSTVAKQTKAMFKLLRKGSQNKSNASLIKIDRVGDVLTESPEKVAEAILFFCQVILSKILVFFLN